MPFPWLAVAVITAAIGTGVSVYSAISQAQAQSSMASYNALIARQNAALAAEQMGIAKKEKDIIAARQARESEKYLAAQRAGFAKAGVGMEGTPLIVAAESMVGAELDALAIRYAGTVEQSQLLAQKAGLQQQETLEKMKGKMYKTAGYLEAGSSLLSGVGTISSMYVGKK